MENPIYLIIITILIVLSICILIIKYFLIPLFFVPKLTQAEEIKFLEKMDCIYIDSRQLTSLEKKENKFETKKGFSFEKMMSEKSEYLIVGFSKLENIYKVFWIELKQWSVFQPKIINEFFIGREISQSRELNYIQETEQKVIMELQKKYARNIVILKDKCPACDNIIKPNDKICSDCGLNLID